jgi:hypothetical protein
LACDDKTARGAMHDDASMVRRAAVTCGRSSLLERIVEPALGEYGRTMKQPIIETALRLTEM